MGPCLCRLVCFASTALTILVFNACERNPTEPDQTPLVPTFVQVSVHEDATNVLSANVVAEVKNAVEAAVEYGTTLPLQARTPFFQVTESVADVSVLALTENTSYLMRMVAVSETGLETVSDTLTFETVALPLDIPPVNLLTADSPAEGFVMFGFTSPPNAPASYAIILNNQGEIVWYRYFPNPVVDFQKQANGLYTAYTSIDETPLHFYEFDSRGTIKRQFMASDGFSTGPHEFQITEAGYVLFAVEEREMDLRSIGGQPNARVRGTAVEFYRAARGLFRWSPFDHLQVSDAAPDMPIDGLNVNPWHGNAIDLDLDGHLLVSFRNSDEVIKINSETGEIIWRLGGKNNQFDFVNDSFGGFSHQHGIRRLKNGHIILFDNGNLHTPQLSRVVEYRLDEKAMTAELVWEYRHDPLIYGFALGFAQRLENGNTLINFGTAQRIIEVDASGHKQWDLSIDSPDRFPYRAFRIPSLY